MIDPYIKTEHIVGTENRASRRISLENLSPNSFLRRINNGDYELADIGRDGCFIKTHEYFKIGDEVNIVINDPITEALWIFKGSVIWKGYKIQKDGLHIYGCGISFYKDENKNFLKVSDAMSDEV